MKDEGTRPAPGSATSEEGEQFLSRWSRLKRAAQASPPQVQPAAARAGDADSAPPVLPPLDQLTPESDFRAFLHPKVEEKLRRAALKKLFSDPHFNVMDGLDVYIDDYSKSDPLPAAALAQLKQAQKILEWARERKEGEGEARAGEAQEQAPARDGALAAPGPSEATVPPAAPAAASVETPPPARKGTA